MMKAKRKTKHQKLKEAVKTLKHYGFITQSEKDNFLIRFKHSFENKKNYNVYDYA